MTDPRTDGYLPIEDYGAIGNLRTVGLIGRDGSLDWLSLPGLTRPTVFAALLDAHRGGRFRIAPPGAPAGEQGYLGDSWVLETAWAVSGARVTVTDFMPLRGSIVGAQDPDTQPAVYRVVRAEGGAAEVEVEWSPRLDYARARPSLYRADWGWAAEAAGERLVLCGAVGGLNVREDEHGPALTGRLRLEPGEAHVLVTGHWTPEVHHSLRAPDQLAVRLDEALRRMRETREVWERWSAAGEGRDIGGWAGAHAHLVRRSALTLKLLTHPDTGAIAAAPTTSLPESIGGVRNWDYRYCWVRDATFTVQSLYALGHAAEADDFFEFLERAAMEYGRRDGDLQIMYGLHGERDLAEAELRHLEGYRGSVPVRIGNGAVDQSQHDVYGELLDGAYHLVERGARFDDDLWRFLGDVADRACEAWRRPDQGIWEMRGPPRHHVYSKVMVWVALDRAARLSAVAPLDGARDRGRWARTRDALHGVILRRGFDTELGAFTQSFGSRSLDAATLLIPIHGFLPPDDPRVESTIDRVMERLMDDGLVYRYLADDGLPGREGAFGLCTFWLVEALALCGRVDEAEAVFDRMAMRANHLGLYAEQIDPGSGAFLGNFPQAFTHIGLIDSLCRLRRVQGEEVPLGTPPGRRAQGGVG